MYMYKLWQINLVQNRRIQQANFIPVTGSAYVTTSARRIMGLHIYENMAAFSPGSMSHTKLLLILFELQNAKSAGPYRYEGLVR